MVRYALIALTLLLAADEFSRSAYAGQTVTGHALQSLAYALTPALLAVTIAGATRYLRRWRGKPDIFAADFNWCWGALLAILYLAHFRTFIGLGVNS